METTSQPTKRALEEPAAPKKKRKKRKKKQRDQKDIERLKKFRQLVGLLKEDGSHVAQLDDAVRLIEGMCSPDSVVKPNQSMFDLVLVRCLDANRADYAAKLYGYITELKLPRSEATFTSMIKILCSQKQLQAAKTLFADMEKEKVRPRLRTVSPLIAGLSEALQETSALSLFGRLPEFAIEPSEQVYACLVSMLSNLASKPGPGRAQRHDKIYELLARMQETVFEISASTMAVLREWFQSPFAGDWRTGKCTVDQHGQCSATAHKLSLVSLTPEELLTLRAEVKKFCSSSEKRAQQLDAFTRWLAEHGPFDVFVDGANVGHYNQNHPGGKFSFEQIDQITRHFEEKENKKVLVVMHRNHFRTLNKFSQDWIDRKILYQVPSGSNDDWYWMYGASLRQTAIVVTNDEMRDHHFKMLSPRFFRKWKEGRQMRFHFYLSKTSDPNPMVLHPPKPFSVRIQRHPRCWHFPLKAAEDVRHDSCVQPDPTTTQIPRNWLYAVRKKVIVYFPVRARTEALRMILAYYKVQYSYFDSSDYFGTKWSQAKAKTPYGQLPIMITHNGQVLAQSGSQCRFAATLGDQSLCPSDAVERAACDSIFEYGQDLSWLNPVVNVYRGDEFKRNMERFEKVWPGARANLVRVLGSGSFLGSRERPSYADFNCWHVVDHAKTLGGDIGALTKWYDKVRQLPGVCEYLSARPDVTGIGTAPMLREKKIN